MCDSCKLLNVSYELKNKINTIPDIAKPGQLILLIIKPE